MRLALGMPFPDAMKHLENPTSLRNRTSSMCQRTAARIVQTELEHFHRCSRRHGNDYRAANISNSTMHFERTTNLGATATFPQPLHLSTHLSPCLTVLLFSRLERIANIIVFVFVLEVLPTPLESRLLQEKRRRACEKRLIYWSFGRQNYIERFGTQRHRFMGARFRRAQGARACSACHFD